LNLFTAPEKKKNNTQQTLEITTAEQEKLIPCFISSAHLVITQS